MKPTTNDKFAFLTLTKHNGKPSVIRKKVVDIWYTGDATFTPIDGLPVCLEHCNIHSIKTQYGRCIMEISGIIHNEKKVAYDEYSGTLEFRIGEFFSSK